MVNAMYIGNEHDFSLRGEIIFVGEKFTHLMAENSDVIFVVPNEDIAPC